MLLYFSLCWCRVRATFLVIQPLKHWIISFAIEPFQKHPTDHELLHVWKHTYCLHLWFNRYTDVTISFYCIMSWTRVYPCRVFGVSSLTHTIPQSVDTKTTYMNAFFLLDSFQMLASRHQGEPLCRHDIWARIRREFAVRVDNNWHRSLEALEGLVSWTWSAFLLQRAHSIVGSLPWPCTCYGVLYVDDGWYESTVYKTVKHVVC